MSSNTLMPFTGKPDYSSAGALPTNYIGQCDPIPFDSDDSGDWMELERWFRFPVCEHSENMQAYFDVRVAEKGGVLTLSEADMYRLYCHAMLQHLPDSAFREAVDA